MGSNQIPSTESKMKTFRFPIEMTIQRTETVLRPIDAMQTALLTLEAIDNPLVDFTGVQVERERFTFKVTADVLVDATSVEHAQAIIVREMNDLAAIELEEVAS